VVAKWRTGQAAACPVGRQRRLLLLPPMQLRFLVVLLYMQVGDKNLIVINLVGL